MSSRRAAALTALAVLVLSGCTSDGGDQPRPLPSLTSTSPVPSSMPAALPTYPATPEGAEKFVRDYYQAAGVASLTGDVDQIRQRSLPSCTACGRAMDFIAKTYAEGGRITGGEQTIRTVGALEVSSTRALVLTEYGLSATVITDGAGQRSEEPPVPVVQDEITLTRQGETWVVSSLEGVE